MWKRKRKRIKIEEKYSIQQLAAGERQTLSEHLFHVSPMPALSSTLRGTDNLYLRPTEGSPGLSGSYLHTPENVLLLLVLL